MRAPTPTHQLIEIRLGRPLEELVQEQLDAGQGWRRIADIVQERTNVTVSYEALRSWFPKQRRRRAA